MLDFHNHLMPGVDDGAADLEEARLGLATMESQGITTIIATPHIGASLTFRKDQLDAYLHKLDVAFASLTELAQREFPKLRLERGVEMALDVPSPKLGDTRLHLAGGDFVLVEFPHMNIPPNSSYPLRELISIGVIPIVAHPERYANISGNIGIVEEWREVGACIQVNAGSLVGQYGGTAKRTVWQILENGWADYMCSDYHARGRCAVSAAGAALDEKAAQAQFYALTVTNPERMLRSERPIPVDPVEDVQLGFWQKVFRR